VAENCCVDPEGSVAPAGLIETQIALEPIPGPLWCFEFASGTAVLGSPRARRVLVAAQPLHIITAPKHAKPVRAKTKNLEFCRPEYWPSHIFLCSRWFISISSSSTAALCKVRS